MVKYCIVFTSNPPKLRAKLLSHGAELILEKAIDKACSHEQARVQLNTMARESHVVHAVQCKTRKRSTNKQTSRLIEGTKTFSKSCGA